MMPLWFLLLGVLSCWAASVSDELVVSVGSVDSVSRGHSVLLPCWLSPPQTAELLEVRWYRENFDAPIMHYQKGTFVWEKQDPSYVDRVSFGLKDSTSGGLKIGDVSLKLVNITLEDPGDYTCYVSSDSSYDSETINLRVTELGTQPLLSVTWTEDNMVNLSCQSEGWYPLPVLRWSNHKEDLTPTSLEYTKASSGHHSVHSWLFIPRTSEISCSVSLSKREAKESRMQVNTPARHEKIESESTGTGWVAFGVLFIATAIMLALLGAMYMREKGKKSKLRSDNTGERETLLITEPQPPTSLSEACKNYRNINLEKTSNQYLTVKDTLVRDAPGVDFPDGPRVSCVTAIRGASGFTAGKHYWEVCLNYNNVGVKQSWWVGVTTAVEITPDFSANATNGFWYLSSSAENLHFSTKPKILPSVNVRPETLGVYLDYDSGELSFYNVGDKTLIGSFVATFSGEVFPLFNPGKGDKSPLKILHREAQSEPESTRSTEENSV